MHPDQTDVKILESLLFNARLSNRQIAKKVGVSVGTVISRMKKMEKEGIVKRYSVRLDQEKLGYEITVIIEITVSKGKLFEMEKEIAKIPNVCAIYNVTGLTDAIVVAKFRSRRELSDFTKAMLAKPYIDRTNTHVVLITMKEDYRLL